jgi:hypothetical protein
MQQLALLPMDLAEFGCDEISQKQLSITLEQLGKVKAPFPEEQQRRLIQLRKHAEGMRVGDTELKSLFTAPPESAACQLRDLVRIILDGWVTINLYGVSSPTHVLRFMQSLEEMTSWTQVLNL